MALIKIASVEEAFQRICTKMRVDCQALKKLVACDKSFGIGGDLPAPDEAIVEMFLEELDACVLK